MRSTVLVMGHSHVNCLMAASRGPGRGNFEVFNFRTRMPDGSLRTNVRGVCDRSLLKNPDPDYVCLCVNGNYHNTLSILEHPEPYSVGAPGTGAAPDTPGRWFVPHSVMLDALRLSMDGIRKTAIDIYDSFPRAERLYFNPPPPVSDWEALRSHPTTFKDKLHLGPGPDALKLQVYAMQTEVLRDFAKDLGATFVDIPAHVRDARGFLDRAYYDRDPTHGNMDYGNIMLNEIMQKTKVPA